jgi:autoinducer 2-degrading protein
MYRRVASFDVDPAHRAEFIEAALDDGRDSVAEEPGTRRFLLIVDETNPNHFFLDETYDDAAAFGTHVDGRHFARFFQRIQGFSADPKVLLGGSSVDFVGPVVTKLQVSDFPDDPDARGNFDGIAALRHIAKDGEPRVSHVQFAIGTRTRPHFHTGTQILWFLEGRGVVGAARNEIPMTCGVGDIVRIEPGFEHWHGAAENGEAAHLAITIGHTVWEGQPGWSERLNGASGQISH